METRAPLSFKPVDLDAHAELCVRFALDLQVLGFGSAEGFHGPDGKGAERHIAHLHKRAASWPGCLVHVWRGEQIIGQINVSCVDSDPDIGYINLLYLVPEARGRGLGTLPETYAWAFLTGHGCRSLRLSASVANTPAWRFYQRNGWQDPGPREDAPGVHLLRSTRAWQPRACRSSSTRTIIWKPRQAACSPLNATSKPWRSVGSNYAPNW